MRVPFRVPAIAAAAAATAAAATTRIAHSRRAGARTRRRREGSRRHPLGQRRADWPQDGAHRVEVPRGCGCGEGARRIVAPREIGVARARRTRPRRTRP